MTGNEGTGVLDASALLAYLRAEQGGIVVKEVIARGAAISAANYAEVLGRLSDLGEPSDRVHQRLVDQGLIGGLIQVEPLTEQDAVVIAQLRPVTQPYGLSLGDRACLALAARLKQPAITADSHWSSLSLNVTVRQIRS